MTRIPDAWHMLRSMCAGDTCIVIGNGPSLADVPISFLNKYDSFASNRLFPEYLPGFCHKWYVAVNPLVIEQGMEEILKLKATAKFISDQYADKIPGSVPLHSFAFRRFSLAPWNGVYEGYTVTFVSLQLAYAIGYKKILLVGVDHRYQYDGKPNQAMMLEGKDPNHFHPDYFSGQMWHNPDLRQSEQAYVMARNFYENHGGQILNLGPDSALEVFEKDRLENW